jgi:hypothetical protein
MVHRTAGGQVGRPGVTGLHSRPQPNVPRACGKRGFYLKPSKKLWIRVLKSESFFLRSSTFLME